MIKMQSLRKTTLALLASASLLPSYANGQELADQVFAAIDDRNDGLKTINKEVSDRETWPPDRSLHTRACLPHGQST